MMYVKKHILYKWGPGVLGSLNLALANGNIWMVITGILLIIMTVMDFFEYDR